MKTEDKILKDTFIGRVYWAFFGHITGLGAFINPTNYNDLRAAKSNIVRLIAFAKERKYLFALPELEKLRVKFNGLEYIKYRASNW